MEIIYPIIIAFTLVFVSELGDKTQLLVMTLSNKQKVITILLGVAIGSLLSHGVAIIFGSYLGSIDNAQVKFVLDLITNIIFILFGIIFLFVKEKNEEQEKGLIEKMKNKSINYILIIAISIAVGELGDKTFLASIGLGIQYPNYKIPLVIGAVLGMVVSDLIAILLGKMISKKIPENIMKKVSGIIFIIFGVVGIIC